MLSLLRILIRRRKSPSTRRAWIEISTDKLPLAFRSASPSTRRAWIEIIGGYYDTPLWVSPSTRRAWIEMCGYRKICLSSAVALHPEGVDRNLVSSPLVYPWATGRPPPGGRG